MNKKQKIDPLMIAYNAMKPITDTNEHLHKYRNWKPSPLSMCPAEFQEAQKQKHNGIKLLDAAMAAFKDPENLEHRLGIMDLAYNVQKDLSRKLPTHKKYDEIEVSIFKARIFGDLGYHGSAVECIIDEIDKIAKVIDLDIYLHKEKYAVLHLALAGFYINAGENSVAEELLKDMIRGGCGDIQSLSDQSARDLLEIAQKNKQLTEVKKKTPLAVFAQG